MANPLFNSLFSMMPQVNSMAQILNAYRSGGNPSAILNQMAQNNPNIKPIVDALNRGTNPQQLFYDLCQKQGVNPETILNQLK